MKEQLKFEVERFIDKTISYIPEKYEIEKKIYDKKIEFIINKNQPDELDNIFGIEINFYDDSSIDIIVLNWDGDIIKSEQMNGFIEDIFSLVDRFVKIELLKDKNI